MFSAYREKPWTKRRSKKPVAFTVLLFLPLFFPFFNFLFNRLKKKYYIRFLIFSVAFFCNQKEEEALNTIYMYFSFQKIPFFFVL